MSTKILDLDGRDILVHSDGSLTFYDNSMNPTTTFGYESGRGYKTWGSKGRRHLVHRIIAMAFLDDFDKNLQVDHVNGVKDDNRLTNLRMVTPSKNQRSFRKNSGVSIYRGVYAHRSGKWKASCRLDGKKKHIGTYATERDAAIARDAFVFSVGYELEGLNFPENHA